MIGLGPALTAYFATQILCLLIVAGIIGGAVVGVLWLIFG